MERCLVQRDETSSLFLFSCASTIASNDSLLSLEYLERYIAALHAECGRLINAECRANEATDSTSQPPSVAGAGDTCIVL